jgi:hypothetical protein
MRCEGGPGDDTLYANIINRILIECEMGCLGYKPDIKRLVKQTGEVSRIVLKQKDRHEYLATM